MAKLFFQDQALAMPKVGTLGGEERTQNTIDFSVKIASLGSLDV